MMKYLKYLLLCAGLLAVLTGCGKTPEENSSGTTLDTSNILETDAESESKSESSTEQETEFTKNAVQTSQASQTSDSQSSETEEISASDTSDASAVTETAPSAQTSSTEVHSTEHIATDAVTSDNPEQNPDPETPDSITWIVSPDTPEAPNTPDAPPKVTQDSVPDVTEPEITEPIAEDPDALNITYQGQVITIGGDVKKFTESIKPNFEQSAPSCMGDGEDIVYYYDDLTIYVWSNAGSMLATGVDVTSPGIAPVQGYDIGSAADFTNEKVIDCGNDCMIILAEAGGQVISISYNKDF